VTLSFDNTYELTSWCEFSNFYAIFGVCYWENNIHCDYSR